MDFGVTDKVRPLITAVRTMVRGEIMPLEEEYDQEIGRDGDRFKPTRRMTEILEGLKAKAGRSIPGTSGSPPPTRATASARSNTPTSPRKWAGRRASEVFNCSAPDTGNMEVLERYGTAEHKERWLKPPARRRYPLGLLHDRARRGLVGRDQYPTEIVRDGDEYVLNGRKWWSSGAGDPRCKISSSWARPTPTTATATSSNR